MKDNKYKKFIVSIIVILLWFILLCFYYLFDKAVWVLILYIVIPVGWIIYNIFKIYSNYIKNKYVVEELKEEEANNNKTLF